MTEFRSGKRLLDAILASDNKLVAVVLSWSIIAVSSVPFDRLNDDEIQYFLESKQILLTGPILHGFVFVPQLLGAIASFVYGSILSVRVVSAIAVLATAIVIYKIGSDSPSFIASMLFLTSFYTIRFGLRFYLDPYGGLFTILAIYAIHRGSSKFAGIWSVLAAFSRQLATPLIPVYAFLIFRKKMSLRSFLIGAILVGLLAFLWIEFARPLPREIAANSVNNIVAIPSIALDSAPLIFKAWVGFLLISPLVILGLMAAPNKRSLVVSYPLVFSFIILSVTPGFIINGGATQYPYTFNMLACVPAGIGLNVIYSKIRRNSQKIVPVVLCILTLQFAGQSYLATTLSPNHVVGVQDWGYGYDEELLVYLGSHYDGGQIYGSNRDGMLLPNIYPNWVWIPQNLAPAIKANPPWLVTFSSYLTIKYLPANVSAVVIGPYLVIHDSSVPLSDFVEINNSTSWRVF
jgi:hypothetical protein